MQDDWFKELQAAYFASIPEKADDLDALILALRECKSVEEAKRAVAELFRRVHSLKGSGGSYGFPALTQIAHQMEDDLSQFAGASSGRGPGGLATLPRRPQEADVERLLRYADLIRNAYSDGRDDAAAETFAAPVLAELRGPAPGSAFQCLIVTESRTLQAALASILRANACEARFSDDGYQALGRLLDDRLDCVIAGTELARLNGFALSAALKLSDGINHSIPVILLSSESNPERIAERSRAAGRGAPDFVLRKDADLEKELGALILRISGKRAD